MIGNLQRYKVDMLGLMFQALCSYPQSAPPPEMSMIPVSQAHIPRIWVPYMDSIALSNVDVNSSPSQEPMGQDLPLNGKTRLISVD